MPTVGDDGDEVTVRFARSSDGEFKFYTSWMIAVFLCKQIAFEAERFCYTVHPCMLDTLAISERKPKVANWVSTKPEKVAAPKKAKRDDGEKALSALSKSKKRKGKSSATEAREVEGGASSSCKHAEQDLCDT